MDPRDLQSLARDCGGTLLAARPGVSIRRVCTDSRTAQPGDLFVCLRGPNFDGHTFAAAAVQCGAVAVLGEAGRLDGQPLACPRVLVPDSRAALGRLAAAHRLRFAIPVVAVAGSNGKTTTKELVAAVLRQRWRTLSSPASFNNDIGLPLTLLELDSRHEAAVVEVGTNHPGELAALLRVARPTHGVLTRLGREHLEFFGDLEGVIEEEGALADFIPPEGSLVMVGDGPGAERIRRRARARVVRVGWSAENDWQVLSASISEAGTDFEARSPWTGLGGDYHLRLLGRHQVENALLALAVGAELGLRRDELEAGLRAAQPARRRLQLAVVGGVRILDDSYNANADSMRAALETLCDLDSGGRRIAVLGDMGEQGAHAAAAHSEVGRAAADAGVTLLFAVGRWARVMAAGARTAGLKACECFTDAAGAAEALLRVVQPEDWVLVKASRSSRLDVVVDSLQRGLAARETDSAPGPGQRREQPCCTP